jgi:hypothetical protein
MPSDSCIPLVPFDSYDEYEENLSQLIKKYQEMVKKGANVAQIASRSRIFQGLSYCVQGHWLEHGKSLFLKLTKGQGEGWCETMNTMVVHALHLGSCVCANQRPYELPSDREHRRSSYCRHYVET